MADALAATELVLAREQHLSQLDGLAAAAAHELGTPLSTIAVVAKELERALEPDSPHADDVALLREQAQRCREILAKLTALPRPARRSTACRCRPDRGGGRAAPQLRHRDRRRAAAPSAAPSRWARATRRSSTASATSSRTRSISPRRGSRSRRDWSDEEVAVTIGDDGPGFAPEIMDRIGEPYVHRAGAAAVKAGGETSGLGLGFFIAKTLLERSGAPLDFDNRACRTTARSWGPLGARRLRAAAHAGL